MTPRQQRRLQQKLARKAEKKLNSQTFPVAATVADAPAPISDRKFVANRANAQLSTGPVSGAGKRTVSQNATRHGLTGKFRVLPGESQADFDQLLTEYMRDEAPADQTETELVQQMAEATWLSRRSVRLQEKCFVAIESGVPEEQQQAKKDLALYLRYMTTQDRAYSRYATELRKRRNEMRRAERGFVSQKHRAAQEVRREAQEIRKKELHDVRHAIQTCRKESMQIKNRVAAAKAERLEMQNLTNREAKTLAAAA